MKLLALLVLNIYSIWGATQTCSYTACLRCGWIPRSGVTVVGADSGSRSFNFGYGSGQGVNWYTIQQSEFVCQLCDAGLGYFLNQNDNTCKQSTTAGPYQACQVVDIFGNCLVCPKDSFFSNMLNSCVVKLNPEPNCDIQQETNVCKKCSSGFYLHNTIKKCVPAMFKIANCQNFKDAISCAQCAQGFIVDRSNGQCIPITVAQNCMAYSNLSCVGCKGSFGMDPNGYRAIVFDMKKPQNTPQSLINMLFNIQLGLPSDQTSLMCTMGRIPNCTAYTMYNQCTACATGFYLSTSTKSCLAMPTFITYNCKTFALATNVLSCSECQTGYKINSGACSILDTYKQGCNQYSTTGANDCTSCEPQYYLATNTCTLRSKAILNCQQLSLTADECLACKEGFWYFSSVSIKTCLPVLQNCKMGFHSAIHVGTSLQVISCTECVPNYLLSQDQLGCGAITTPIKNCDGYNKNNYCQTCTNGFLTSTQCNKQHSLIDQCGRYSQINQNSCVQCRPSTFKRTTTNYCYNPKVTSISNCATYDFTLLRCKTCQSKYRLSDDRSQCIAFPSNCAVLDTTDLKTCGKCDNGYGLALQYTSATESFTWVCQPIAVYKSSMCAATAYVDNTVSPPTSSSTGEEDYFFAQKCKNCINSTIPSYGRYQCMSTSELSYFHDYNFKGPAVDKCIRYSYYFAIATPVTVANAKRGLDTADFTWSCEACQAGYWLVEDTSSTTETTTPARRKCVQSQKSNATNMLCFYQMVQKTDATLTTFSLRQNTCIYDTTAFDSAAKLAQNKNAYVALNVNLKLFTADNTSYLTQTFPPTFYDLQFNQSAHTTASRKYTVIDCITDSTNVTTYVKQFVDLQQFDASNITLDATSISSVTHPLTTTIGFDQCVVAETTTNLNAIVANCQYYYQIAGLLSGKAACVACKDKFIGTHNGTGAYTLTSCEANTDTIPSNWVNYQNISPKFGKFLSVQTCSTTGEIPILFLWMKSKTDGATAFYALNYANGGHDKLFMGYTMADSSVYSKTVKCINPFTQGSIISALNISTAITTVKALPANCAYGILDTEFTRSTFDNTQAAGTQFAMACLQCKPGYKPYYKNSGGTALEKISVIECRVIQFCDLTSNNIYLDACGKCATNFAYAYNYTEGDPVVSEIDYTSCVWGGSKRQNCLAIIGTTNSYGQKFNESTVSPTSATSACVVCKRGYSLSLDKTSCILEATSQCSSSNYLKYNLNDALTGAAPFVTETYGAVVVKVRDAKFLSFYFQQGGDGCQQCNTGFTSIFNPGMTPLATYPVVAYNLPTTTIARLNTYVMTKSYNTANNYNLMCASQTSNLVNYDNGIPNCQEYIYAASTLKCQLCASGYVVTADQLKCYSADQLPNCLTADSANTHKCTKCVLGFILLNVDQLGGSAPEAQCVPHVIPNCLTYSQVAVTLSAGTITINGGSNKYFQDFCSQCNPGYFRNAFGQCSPGPTPYCSTYTALATIDTQPVCTVCFKGYVLMKVTGQTDVFHCVPSLASMGCEGKTGANYHYEYVNDGTNANVNMNCLTCDSPFNKVVALNASQTVSSGLIKTDCMFKLRIPNCQIQKDAYNSDNPTVNTNYQICTQCSHGFYLKATINKINQCFPRMNTDPNCATFVVADDLCQTCGANYYLSSDSKTCIPYPTQIQNCDQYSNMDCSRCYNATTPVYLSQGSCVTVPTASIIKDCAYYSNSSTCSQCSATFLLSNNTCVKYDVANCLVQTKTGVCDQCSSGYVFQDSSKSACATTTVTNCATLNQTTKTCLICNVGYYLKADGTCVMAQLIPGCQLYDSSTTCTKCESLLFLNFTRTACQINDDNLSRCTNTFAQPQTSCTQCWPTYKMVGGICTQPSGAPEDPSFNEIQGCLIQSVRNRILCEVCQSGYIMNSTMTCQQTTSAAPVVTPIIPASNTTKSSVGLVSILAKTLGLIGLLLLL